MWRSQHEARRLSLVFKGRLGLETAQVPHGDRHGCLWLSRASLYVQEGTLRFQTTGTSELAAGDYAIPFQGVSTLVLGPGTSLTHDVLRLCARHGTALVFTGDDAVRYYASMPFGADSSRLARLQVTAWANPVVRTQLARRMYAIRLRELLPSEDLAALRGIEGARVKTLYRRLAEMHGVAWEGRRYNRNDPDSTDDVNQAVNHATTAVLAAAKVAVAVTSTIPQLGFIHEDSAQAFTLDIADLFREEIAIDTAFAAVKQFQEDPSIPLENRVRRMVGATMREKKVVPDMIDRIKDLFDPPADKAHTQPGA
jgi:CRISP-associated protein Cas1